jgi:hypothetical protein
MNEGGTVMGPTMHHQGKHDGDFPVILMLAAVIGALTQAITTVINVGRAAEWWP